MPTPPRRRWYQFGLGELLILITLVTFIWVLSARCWVLDEVIGWDGKPAGLAWSEPDEFDVFRRGSIGTGVLLAIWCMGRALIRRWSRSDSQS